MELGDCHATSPHVTDVASMPCRSYSLATAISTCRAWRDAGRSSGLWQRQLSLEYGLPPSAAMRVSSTASPLQAFATIQVCCRCCADMGRACMCMC